MKISGRKFATIAIISTYCVSIIGSLILTIMKRMELPILLGVMSGLGTLAMYIVKAYFDDKDRKKEE